MTRHDRLEEDRDAKEKRRAKLQEVAEELGEVGWCPEREDEE